MDKLKFTKGKNNRKLNKFEDTRGLYAFSLPAGITCPYAKDCKSITGRDGKLLQSSIIRCYFASLMSAYTNTRKLAYYNYDVLQSTKNNQWYKLISDSLPDNSKIIRLHVGGDYFNQVYFDAWLKVAIMNPNIIFYGYTKSLLYWINRLNIIPANLRLVASYGGKHDHLITDYGLIYAKIILPNQIEECKLPIADTDFMAFHAKESFAILLHGTQSLKSRDYNQLNIKGL